MERQEVEHWLRNHPGAVRTDPHQLLDRCEREVRAHAAEDAWRHAKTIVEGHLHEYAASFGLPASDAFVAREVCHEMARELRRREPTPGSDVARVSEQLLGALEPAARERLLAWLGEVAGREEHKTWRYVVRFTDHLARELVRDGWSDVLRWDFDHSYSRTAERVTRLLIQEYDQHARGRELCDDIE